MTTIFLWGYSGWGNAPECFVKLATLVEQSRGFQPPTFVDIRDHRNVRAVGFNADAFKRLVPDRYLWFKEFGNRSKNKESNIVINHPLDTAFKLLDVAFAEARDGRRPIVFCSCKNPYPQGLDGLPCHRVPVGDLLLAVAHSQGLPIEVVEWPGGEPIEDPAVEFNAAPQTMARKTIPLPRSLMEDGLPVAKIASIPWCSTVRARTGDNSLTRVVGPPEFLRREWCLPVLDCPPDISASAYRNTHGFAHKFSPDNHWWQGERLENLAKLVIARTSPAR